MSRILFGIFLCLFLNVNLFAQSSTGYFYITGSVKVEQGLVDNTRIQVYRDGDLMNTVLINRTGKFRIKLALNSLYRFEVTKDGFYPKTIEFNAHVPPEACNSNCVFPPYQLALMLYKKVPGVKETNAEVGRISYNSQIDNFDAEILRDRISQNDKLLQIMQEIKATSKRYELQKEKDKKAKYDQAVTEADRLFRAGDYERAMHRYRDAVLIFPQILYPRNRVDESYQKMIAIELKAALGAPTKENFSKYLNYGKLQLDDREYTVAKVCFEKIVHLEPNDTALREKLNKSNNELETLRQLAMTEVEHRESAYSDRKTKYNQLIQQADEQFKQEQLAAAKDLYAQAATQINENSYAVLMIDKIETLISDDTAALQLAKEREAAEKARLKKARDQAYNDAIEEADRMFEQRLYRDAIENYELALTIKSFELYPKTQIRLIKSILADLQLSGEEYNRLVRQADALFNAQNYTDARAVYEQAHQVIKEEKYALQKIDEIDRLLAAKKNDNVVDQKYLTFIKAADQLFRQEKYNEALPAYQQALMVKPQEDYPKQQIKKIRGILSRETDLQKRLTQKQNDYNQVVAMADTAFYQKSYSGARSLYQEALQIIPGQEYPSSQIWKIDAIMREEARQKTKQSKLDQIDFSNLQNVSENDRKAAYEEAMQLGTEFMKTKEWGIARFYFRRALALYPHDGVAANKLDEVDEKILGSNVNEAKFTEMIKKADEAYKTGDFGVAKFYYTKARDANPTDQYVNERLTVVEKLAANTAERTANKEFDSTMKKANDAFTAKNYSVARFFYRKALGLKPNDSNVKQQLEKIKSLMNQ